LEHLIKLHVFLKTYFHLRNEDLDPAARWVFAVMVRFHNTIEDGEHATNKTNVQVLNKRKPVHLIPPPTNLTDTTEVNIKSRLMDTNNF
jgi:hypothetical protein